jgi:putative acetyltransferase
MVSQSGFTEIILYANEHHEVFRQLNMEWLKAYDLVEDHDLMVLDDPQGTILDRGGIIFLAMCDGNIVGSSALMKTGDKDYELAKMSVTSDYRGRGISKMLLDKCLDHARSTGAEKISLFSNHNLTSAISLYEKYGFKHIPVKDSPFETADVRMELIL